MRKNVLNVLGIIFILFMFVEIIFIHNKIYSKKEIENIHKDKPINNIVSAEGLSDGKLELGDLLNNLYAIEKNIKVKSISLNNNEAKVDLEVMDEKGIEDVKAINSKVKIQHINKKADSNMSITCIFEIEK
ncbi:hypothetical protein IAI10_07980 [Clostridium sp. 19966]|uniref:hypothetical protein n=1 Tax=Clostridium sp. 19966 TaxID=2768166 RepID=UPI0028DE082A|nr:hypothetical protein [Clostridium sp. 19966]MDT8716592.1 hypothetical protein [Clostridium sp. 19966]